MKNTLIIKSIAACLLILSPQVGEAGFPVYPPLSTPDGHFLVFRDSDNEASMKKCRSTSSVCARFYVLPPAYKLATNKETGAKMLTQGIFPSRSRFEHKVIYNLTLQPELEGLEDLRRYLKNDVISPSETTYNVSAREDQIIVAPLPGADLQIISTGLPGAGDDENGGLEEAADDEEGEVEEPNQDPENPANEGDVKAPQLAQEEIEKIAKNVSRSVRFTKFYAPNWKGEVHSLGQQFSISVQGRTWDLEPAFQNMFLSPGGNAVIGTVSFRFRAHATPLKVSLSCNLKTFQQVVNSTRKSWNIYRYNSPRKSVERFNNDEWNSIRSALNVDDFCTISEYKDTTIPQSKAMETLRDLLFKRMLDRAFNTVTNRPTPTPENGNDPKYTHYESKAIDDATANISLDIQNESIIWLSSDVDLNAGGIDEANLDPNHWSLCSHWELPNPRTRTCEAVCEPWTEVYWKGHPKARVPEFGDIHVRACVLYSDLQSNEE